MKMKVELHGQLFPFNYNLIGLMSAITPERYNDFGKTSYND